MTNNTNSQAIKNSKKNILLNGIIKENPLFVLLLGTCPALATTTSIESALGMGILFIFVLIGSNVVVSLLRKLVPPQIKIPMYIVIIATFVTIVKMLCEAILPDLYDTLGVFISLIVVNCIVLGRAESFASQNRVSDSLLDAIGMGLGYTIAIVIIAFIREFLGTGGFTLGKVLTFLPSVSFLPLKDYAISLFIRPAGAFLVLGIVLAIISAYNQRKVSKEKYLLKQKKLSELKKIVDTDKKIDEKTINDKGGTKWILP